MKVVCIDNDSVEEALKIGEVYNAEDISEAKYIISFTELQNGNIGWYYKERFRLLDEIREEKLNIILG